MNFNSKYFLNRHQLKDDVRESLYDLCNEWTDSLEGRTFQGGTYPNLADLNFYGAIGSFEGTQSFQDMMKNTSIKNWYDAMKEQVENSKGSLLLSNPHKVKEMNKSSPSETKKSKRFFLF